MKEPQIKLIERNLAHLNICTTDSAVISFYEYRVQKEKQKLTWKKMAVCNDTVAALP